MSMLDIFNSNAFGVIELTNALEKLVYIPGRLGQLGLFSDRGIATISAAIEQRDGLLVYVPPSPRGGPGMTVTKQLRNMLSVTVPHFQIDDAIMAEEVQGVRAWGQETAVEMVMTKLAERGLIFTQSLEATHEYARVGAIKGLVTYADGSQLNLQTLFGITPLPEVHLNLAPSPAATGGTMRRALAGIVRSMADELGGLPYSGIRAFCGNAFFDDLIQNPDVRTTYLNQIGAAELRTGALGMMPAGQRDKIYGQFTFGDITWENYRGAIGGVPFIENDLCHFVPEGVPQLFMRFLAPADYIETVNTIGRPLYAKQWPMPNDKGINLEFQTNALHICTRPRALLTATRLV